MMMLRQILYLVSVFVKVEDCFGWCSVANFEKQYLSEEPLDYLLLRSLNVPTLSECIRACVFNWKCSSVFYCASTSQCQLYLGRMSSLEFKSPKTSNWYGYNLPGRPIPGAYKACDSGKGYIFNEGAHMCYKLFTVGQKWNHARQTCHNDNAELIMLNTPTKYEIVKDIVTQDGVSEYHLGARDDGKDGEWRWVIDNSVVAGFNKLGVDQCMEIQENLKYDDTACDFQEQKFFCEISL